MGSKTVPVKLKDICTKIGSGATPRGGKESYYTSGISLIRSQNVLDFSFSYNGIAFINNEQAAQLNNVTIQENDVLVNITGDSVARACLVPKEVLPARVNQHVSIIRANSRADSKYILYFLQFEKQHLLSIGSCGGTRNALTKEMLENLELDLPTIEQQKRISATLSSLDDKIELNNHIIANLEAQAQAIFKSWFVDFEPFQDGEFEESELGLIPKGWRVGTLNELIDIRYGKDHKRLGDGNIPVYGSGGIMRFADEAIYSEESVLIPRKGTLSNVLYVTDQFWTVDTMFYTVMRKNNIAKFVYLFVLGLDLASMNSGSAVPSMTTNILNAIQLVIPKDEVFESFETVVSPMYKAMKQLDMQNEKLAQLRDSLLPKLMSGEMEVPVEG